MTYPALRFFCLNIMLAILCIVSPSALAEEGFVHGSWVNLRASPTTTASIRGQLTTNTKLVVVARQESWCSVKTPGGLEGFLACDLLGPAPLTLEQAAGHPGRAFWIAPSVGRFISYGSLLRSGAAYKRMFASLKDGEEARIPPLPEFSAAKRLMQAGVIPQVSAEVVRGEPVNPGQMEYAKALQPKPIKPSLFRAHADVVLTSEGDADSVAAVSGTRVALKVVAPPLAHSAQHYAPDVTGITGFGDIGEAELLFNPPITVYSVLPRGLVAAAHVAKERRVGLPRESGDCGKHYTGKRSFGSILEGERGNEYERWPSTPLKDYAKRNATLDPLASFVTAKPFVARKVKIVSRLAKITNFIDPRPVDPNDTSRQKLPDSAKVVLHEIDLDGDDVADILLWELPSIGSMSGTFNVARSWFLNINGSWFAAGGMDDGECT